MSVRKVRLNQALADELKEYIATLENHGPKDRLFPLLKEHLRYTLMRGTESRSQPDNNPLLQTLPYYNLIAAGYSPADIAARESPFISRFIILMPSRMLKATLQTV